MPKNHIWTNGIYSYTKQFPYLLIHPWATLCYTNTSLCENSYSACNKIITQQFKLLLFLSQNLSANTGDAGVAISIPGSGRFLEKEMPNSTSVFLLGKSMGRGSQTVAHGVTKTQLSEQTHTVSSLENIHHLTSVLST